MPAMNPATLAPGQRVRYRYAHRMFGVLDKRVQRRSDLWWVFWENGERQQAFESNLEVIDGAFRDYKVRDADSA
jgi:hypothetical protein